MEQQAMGEANLPASPPPARFGCVHCGAHKVVRTVLSGCCSNCGHCELVAVAPCPGVEAAVAAR